VRGSQITSQQPSLITPCTTQYAQTRSKALSSPPQPQSLLSSSQSQVQECETLNILSHDIFSNQHRGRVVSRRLSRYSFQRQIRLDFPPQGRDNNDGEEGVEQRAPSVEAHVSECDSETWTEKVMNYLDGRTLVYTRRRLSPGIPDGEKKKKTGYISPFSYSRRPFLCSL
jgi:hypothetical protein